jgi:hypothetical protein
MLARVSSTEAPRKVDHRSCEPLASRRATNGSEGAE